MKAKKEIDLVERVWPFVHPRGYVYTAILGCIFAGSAQPIWAIVYAKAVSMLTMPFAFVPYAYSDDIMPNETAKEYVSR